MIQTLNIKCNTRAAELKRGNDFVMKLLLNPFSLTARCFFHAHSFIVLHVHTSELLSTASLCVVAVVVHDDGHFKASLQQLFTD